MAADPRTSPRSAIPETWDNTPMPATAVREAGTAPASRMRVVLLGAFTIRLGARSVGPWYRPSAKRLCELLMLSPDLTLAREVAREALFPNLSPAASASALSRALSLARDALSALGEEGPRLLRSDRARISVADEIPLEIDLVVHEAALRSALRMTSGSERDLALASALLQRSTLLEDEPYAEWALGPRDALELLRQQARLELARDRMRGRGLSHPGAVTEAWEACLVYDPASEEAASALIRIYSSQGQRQLASRTYERCRVALEALGLAPSPALNEARDALSGEALKIVDGVSYTVVSGRHAEQERRLVSVLFVELSGLPSPERSEPEETRHMVGSVLANVIAEVEALGGTVTSVSGAGLAALFGAPATHEDDPERAVRAAYRLLSAARTPGVGTPRLSVRVGIETGLAVVGPLWESPRASYGAVGKVTEDAAALQSAAKPGSVLVGQITKRATDHLFDWGPTEQISTGSEAKPMSAVYLDRPKPPRAGTIRQSRFGGHARLVGRQTELSMLDEAVQKVTAGNGSIIFLASEPGLGKTRLVQECRKRFMAWVGAATGRLPLWLEGRCASYASSTPYGLYQQLLSAWIRVGPEEGDEVVLPAVTRAARAIFGCDTEHVDFLAHMLGVRATPNGARVARLSPEGLRRATFASVCAVVEHLVARGPTVLALEDLHWADATSLRLTEELSGLAGQGSLLLIATRRLEPDPGVSALECALGTNSGGAFTRIELAPLDDDDQIELALCLLGGTAENDAVATVRENADGVPLFLEERFSSLVESGALVKDGPSWSVDRSISADTPEVLERLIRARIDRLPPPARDVVVAGSVLGTDFSFSALSAVAGVKEDLIGVARALCAARLLTEVRQWPEPAYRFRHALIQEAIYAALLTSQRRQFHARTAWGLEAASAGHLEEVAAVLGHHYTMAAEPARALHFYELAARHAFGHFAVDEAVASYRRAIEIVDKPVATAREAEASVDLRYKLSEVLWRAGRFDDARETLGEGLARVDPCHRVLAARLYARLGRVESESYHYDDAIAAFDAADELLGGAPQERDAGWVDTWLEVQVDGRANAHNWNNKPQQAAAALVRARPVLERAGSRGRKTSFYLQLALAQAIENRWRIDPEILGNAELAAKVAEQDVGEHDIAYCRGNLGEMLLWHGQLEAAWDNIQAALALAERTGDRVCRTWCLFNLSLICARKHDVGGARSLVPQALETAVVAKNPVYTGAATAAMAWVAWKDHRPDDVARLARRALEVWRASSTQYHFKGLCLWPLMSVHLAAGHLAHAVEAGRQMLGPPQVRLPDELESLLEAADSAWSRHRPASVGPILDRALGLACELGYA